MTTTEGFGPAELLRDTHDEALGMVATLATECQRLRDIIHVIQRSIDTEVVRIELDGEAQRLADERGGARFGFTVSVVGGDEAARSLWIGEEFGRFFNDYIVASDMRTAAATQRAEKAEESARKQAEVRLQAQIERDNMEARAEQAERKRDEEREQRIREAALASGAIEHLRALAEHAIPTLDECLCPRQGAGDCSACQRRKEIPAARAWLEAVKV